MRSLQLAVALAALAAAGTGCSGQRELLSPRVVSESEGIRIAAQASEIVLENNSAEPVRFAVVERDYFERALVMWGFGFGTGGTLVSVSRSGAVKLSEVPGYSNAAREVLVFWWFERPSATDQEKAAGVRRVSVPIV